MVTREVPHEKNIKLKSMQVNTRRNVARITKRAVDILTN